MYVEILQEWFLQSLKRSDFQYERWVIGEQILNERWTELGERLQHAARAQTWAHDEQQHSGWDEGILRLLHK